MKKMAGLMSIVFASLLAVAQMPGGPPAPPKMERWWANPMVVQQLGLTDAQIKQLDQLAVNTAMKLIDEKAAVEKQQLQLMALFIPDTLDQVKYRQQVDALLTAESTTKRTLLDALLQGYNLLTPEQQKKAKTLLQNAEFMRHMGMGGPERRMGEGRRPVPPPKPQ